MRHSFIAMLAVLGLAACSKSPPVEDPVRAVRTLTVQAGSVALQHEYAAEIRARVESRLSFQVPGKLVSRVANLGEHVSAGRPLARLDARDLLLGQEAAQASLTSAKALLALAENEYKRFKELRDQGFISGLELDRRETTLNAARATVQQAQAQTSLQGNQAGYAVLTSHTSGVVTAVDAEPGMVLAAGTPVLRLAHDGPRDAVFSVPEDRIGAVRAMMGRGGLLHLRVWGSDAEPVAATVREVSAAADPTSRTFLVKADVGAAPVRLGQTATVLVNAPVGAAIKLPLHAVFGQGQQSMVWLVDRQAMTVRQQPISVAGADGNLVVVAKGLTPGDVVVTAGVHTLTQGQKVRWYNEPAAAPGPQAAASGATPAAGGASAPAPAAASAARSTAPSAASAASR